MFSSSSGSGKKAPPPPQVGVVRYPPSIPLPLSQEVPTDITCGLQEMVQVGTCPLLQQGAETRAVKSDARLTVTTIARPVRVSYPTHSITSVAELPTNGIVQLDIALL